jgi:hypothetical protein
MVVTHAQERMTLTLISGSALLYLMLAYTKEQVQRRNNSTATRNVNETEEGQLSIIDHLRLVPHQVSIPDRNRNRVIVIGELSH